MKKILILSITVLFLTASCRKEESYFMNPVDYENVLAARTTPVTSYFEIVWNAINTGYAFWDITDVDWDRRYLDFKPRFENLEEDLFSGKISDLQVYYDSLQVLYDALLYGLKDGHMVVEVGSAANHTFSKPSEAYNESRSHDDWYAEEFRNTFLKELAVNPIVSDFDSCYFSYGAGNAGHCTCIITLSNGKKVPYLWSSDFVTASTIESFIASGLDSTQVEQAKKWQPIYDKYLDNFINTPKNELGGVILDLRANNGGALTSLPNYINIFAGEEHTYWETRYKEGMGRYDMSAWIPFEFGMPDRHRDLAAESIPVVVLCDVNTVSCAELTCGSIKQMPTAHLIGERTWGGHGPLSGQDDKAFSHTYGGVCGDPNLTKGYFIYTSNFENRPVGGQILEGIGISPDEEVLYKDAGYRGQFDAAVKYLESNNLGKTTTEERNFASQYN